MTTYTAIADADIDPESPGNTTLFTRLRDNPIAAFEKAAGAPVLANDYITNAMIATNAVNADSIAANAVGTSEIASGVVASEYSATAVGAVGSLAFLVNAIADPPSHNPGDTFAGSSLDYAGVYADPPYSGVAAYGASVATSPSGTWRCMGYDASQSGVTKRGATLLMRIS